MPDQGDIFPEEAIFIVAAVSLERSYPILLNEFFYANLVSPASFVLQNRQVVELLKMHPPKSVFNWAVAWSDKRQSRLVRMELQERLLLCLLSGLKSDDPEIHRILEGVQIRLDSGDTRTRRLALLMAEFLASLRPTKDDIKASAFTSLLAKEQLENNDFVADCRYAHQFKPIVYDDDDSDDDNVLHCDEVKRQRAYLAAGMPIPANKPELARPRSLIAAVEMLQSENTFGPKTLFALEALPDLLQKQGSSLFLQEQGCLLLDLLVRIPPDFIPSSNESPMPISAAIKELFMARCESNPRPIRRLLFAHLQHKWFGKSGGPLPTDPLISRFRNITLSFGQRMAVLGYVLDLFNTDRLPIKDNAEQKRLFDLLFHKSSDTKASSVGGSLRRDLVEVFFLPFARQVVNERLLLANAPMAQRVLLFSALVLDASRHELYLTDALSSTCYLLERFFSIDALDRSVSKALLLTLRQCLGQWPRKIESAFPGAVGFLSRCARFLESGSSEEDETSRECVQLFHRLTSFDSVLKQATAQKDDISIIRERSVTLPPQ